MAFLWIARDDVATSPSAPISKALTNIKQTLAKTLMVAMNERITDLPGKSVRKLLQI